MDEKFFAEHKYMQLRGLLSQAQTILEAQKEFEQVKISVKPMSIGEKKHSYWSLLRSRKIQSGQKIYNMWVDIYVNIRDLTTPEKVCHAIAHEAAHILNSDGTFEIELNHYYNVLKEEMQK